MNTSDKQRHPRRMLSSGFTLAVTVGGIIGLGIFRMRGGVAAVASDPSRFCFFSTWVGDRYRVLVDIQTYVCALLFHDLPAPGTFWFATRRAQEAAGTEENIHERCQKAKNAESDRVR